MIRLSEIDVENRNEFGKDVCPRIRDLLLKERENQDFDAERSDQPNWSYC